MRTKSETDLLALLLIHAADQPEGTLEIDEVSVDAHGYDLLRGNYTVTTFPPLPGGRKWRVVVKWTRKCDWCAGGGQCPACAGSGQIPK